MSPLANETIANTPLAGHELAKLILADVEAMLADDCMLTASVAYRRCSYELRLTLHMDNPAFALSESRFSSRPRAAQAIAAEPALAAIELHPLAPPTSAESFLSATERHRDMESPNAVRIQQGLPIAVITRDSAGHHVEQQLRYPADYADDQPDATPPPSDTDVTADEAARLGITASPTARESALAAAEVADMLTDEATVIGAGSDRCR